MKTNWTAPLALFAAVVIGGVPGAAQANLLSNASFESVLEYGDPTLANWFAFFGAGSTGTFSTIDAGYSGVIDPTDGSHHLSITNDGTPSGFSGVVQRVPGAGGVEYTFSFDARSNSGASFPMGAEYRFEWFGPGETFLGATANVAIGGVLTDQYDNYGITATSPVGTTEVRTVIAVETFSASGVAGDLFVDNASLTAVPEPTAFGLLGLAGLACLARKRRR